MRRHLLGEESHSSDSAPGRHLLGTAASRFWPGQAMPRPMGAPASSPGRAQPAACRLLRCPPLAMPLQPYPAAGCTRCWPCPAYRVLVTQARTLRLGRREWLPGSTAVMAVINRTPDSFFDQGATREFGAALEAASRAVAAGADIVDIGGVKAGPGDDVSPAEEIRRVAGLVAAVRDRHPGIVISVDTWRAEVAEAV